MEGPRKSCHFGSTAALVSAIARPLKASLKTLSCGGSPARYTHWQAIHAYPLELGAPWPAARRTHLLRLRGDAQENPYAKARRKENKGRILIGKDCGDHRHPSVSSPQGGSNLNLAAVAQHRREQPRPRDLG
jgi:hypothetical protein